MSFQVLNVDGQLPEWLDSLATVNLLQATPGKLVMFLTERFKWPGQMDLVLWSFWNGWKMLEVGLGGSRAGTLEPNFSKSYFGLLSLLPTNVPPSPSVGVSGHCSLATPLFSFRYSHTCAGRTTTLQTWWLGLRPLGSFEHWVSFMWSRIFMLHVQGGRRSVYFYSTFPNQLQSIFCGREARLKSVSLP